MKEREWVQKVIEMCNALGLRTHRLDRDPSGFPNLTVAGPHGVVFLELKSEKAPTTPQQEAWVKALTAGGCAAMVAKPHDYDYVLNHLKRIAGK